jgi:hypothetical protein
MIKKICDKCGKTINTNYDSNTIFPMLTINRIRSMQVGWESIDLCPECSKIFESWLDDRSNEIATDFVDTAEKAAKVEIVSEKDAQAASDAWKEMSKRISEADHE